MNLEHAMKVVNLAKESGPTVLILTSEEYDSTSEEVRRVLSDGGVKIDTDKYRHIINYDLRKRYEKKKPWSKSH
jgi:hypothetical protein